MPRWFKNPFRGKKKKDDTASGSTGRRRTSGTSGMGVSVKDNVPIYEPGQRDSDVSTASEEKYESVCSRSSQELSSRRPDERLTEVDQKLAYCALDIGTTYSGWAYSLSTEGDDIDNVKTHTKTWNSDYGAAEKTTTCILIEQRNGVYKTLAFGYDAESRYTDMRSTKTYGTNVYYFSRFKMELYKSNNEGVSIDFTIPEVSNQRSMPALEVFALTIQFLKDDVLEDFEKRCLGVVGSADTSWALTVPAIWTEAAKQFMRHAALKAGIICDDLIIVLEPEAAAVQCRRIPLVREGTTSMLSSMKAGTTYLVVDAGGGTVDMTVHEIVGTSGLREVTNATGGDHGGRKVNICWKEYIKNLVGKNVWDDFEKKHSEDLVELDNDIEVKKRHFKTDGEQVKLKMPGSLTVIYREHHSETEGPFHSTNKIKIDNATVKSFFDPVIGSIVELIKSVLAENKCNCILLVGGFAESSYLQTVLKQEFINVKLVIPNNPSTCVLTGAVQFRRTPGIISERVARYTYGLDAYAPVKHRRSKTSIKDDDGTVWERVFNIHVRRGETVKVGRPPSCQMYDTFSGRHKSMTFTIYATEEDSPKEVNTNCFKVGQIRVNLLDRGEDEKRTVIVQFHYSGTEIRVEAVDEKSGTVTTVPILL